MVDQAYVDQLQGTAYKIAELELGLQVAKTALGEEQTDGALAEGAARTDASVPTAVAVSPATSLSAEIAQPAPQTQPIPVDGALEINASMALRNVMDAANEVMEKIDTADAGAKEALQTDLSYLLSSAAALSDVIARPASLEMVNTALLEAANALAAQQDDEVSLDDPSVSSGKSKRAVSQQRLDMAKAVREKILHSPQAIPDSIEVQAPLAETPESQPLPPEVQSYISETAEQAVGLAMTGALVGTAAAYAANEMQQQRSSNVPLPPETSLTVSDAAQENAIMSVAYNALAPEHRAIVNAIVPETTQLYTLASNDQIPLISPDAAQKLQEYLSFVEKNNILTPEAVSRAFEARTVLAAGTPEGMSQQTAQEQSVNADYTLALAALSANVSAVKQAVAPRAVVQENSAASAMPEMSETHAQNALAAQPYPLVTQAQTHGMTAPAPTFEQLQGTY